MNAVILCAAHIAQPGTPKTVIAGVFIGIRKHTVGFVDFFEFFFSIRFAIHIWMELARQFTEGLLDLILRGCPRETKNFIVVTISRHGLIPSKGAGVALRPAGIRLQWDRTPGP